MAMRITCPGCGRQLTVKDEHTGRTGKCPGCGKRIVIPAAGSPVGPGAREAGGPGVAPEEKAGGQRASARGPVAEAGPVPAVPHARKRWRPRTKLVAAIAGGAVGLFVAALAVAALKGRGAPGADATAQDVMSILGKPTESGQDRCRQTWEAIRGRRVNWTLYPGEDGVYTETEKGQEHIYFAHAFPQGSPENRLKVLLQLRSGKHDRFLQDLRESPDKEFTIRVDARAVDRQFADVWTSLQEAEQGSALPFAFVDLLEPPYSVSIQR